MDVLVTLWVIVMIVSALAIVVGIIMVIYNSIKNKSNAVALKILLTGVIVFIIGFGTCFAIATGGF